MSSNEIPSDGQIIVVLAAKAGCNPAYFSPLTEWEDLGQLIEESRISILPSIGGRWQAKTHTKWWQADDIKRAVCLALYYEEAHGGRDEQ